MHTMQRMRLALEGMTAKWPTRRAKAFYLGPDDWTDFIATKPGYIDSIHNNFPVSEPAFEGVPVRRSLNVAPRQSRLYDQSGCGRLLDALIAGRLDRRRARLPGQLAALEKARAASAETRRKLKAHGCYKSDIIVALDPGEGLLTWKSSPHVMWLGWSQAGNGGDLPPA